MTEDQLIEVFVHLPRCGWNDGLDEFAKRVGLPAEVAAELWPRWSQLWMAVAAIGPANLARIVRSCEKPEPPPIETP
jgi:hypothetical protein